MAVFAVILLSDPEGEPQLPEGPGADELASDPLPDGATDSDENEALASANAPPLPTESGPLVVDLRYLGGLDQERIRPKRSGLLEGQVLDAAKEGLAGVRLTIVGGPQDGWTTISREGGSYTFPELLPGTHWFRLVVPGYGETVRSQRVQDRGRTRRDFRVSKPVAFELEVHDHQNKPLAGALVRAEGSLFETMTDDRGLALVTGILGGDRVAITVEAEGHVPIRQELNLLRQIDAGPPIQVPALMKGAVLQGTVRSWPGGPLPMVTVLPRSNRIGTHQVLWEKWQQVPVDYDGRFRLENLPTTHMIDVRIFHPGGVAEPRVRAVRPGPDTATTVHFVVKRGEGRVAGRVLDAAGEGVAGSRVVLEAEDPSALLAALYPGLAESPSTVRLPVPAALRRELITGRSGKFDFAVGDHPKGTGGMVLTVSKEGYTPVRKPILRSYEDLRVELDPEDRSGALVLTQSGEVEAEVRWFLDGEPLAEASGLRVGLYDLVIRSGDEVLRHDEAFALRGVQQLSPK